MPLDFRGYTPEAVVLVAGSTGHQGGAVARHLLEQGFRVRGLTRDPNQPSARALRELGAEIVQGDLMDRGSLDALMESVWGVFSVETPREAGWEGEVQEGRNLADAAMAAKVHHFVYSSVFGADDTNNDAPWVRGKRELEGYLAGLDMSVTVFRPATFMENFLPHREEIVGGVVKGLEAPDTPKHFIAVDDIGRFVAKAFNDPSTWVGKTTDIAGDRCTMAEVARTFSAALKRDVRYEQTPPPEGMSVPGAPKKMIDIEQLRAILPNLKTVADWAASVDWRLESGGAQQMAGAVTSRERGAD